MIHRIAGVAEHDGAGRFDKSQHIDDRMFDVARCDADRAVFDVGVTAVAARDFDAERIVLVLLGNGNNGSGQRRRKQQRAARVRRDLEDEFHVLAKTQIEHFVGLVQHDGFQLSDVEPLAADVIAKSARRADDNVCTGFEFAFLALRVHAAHTRDDARARILIKPCQFAVDLQCKFAGRRDDQR